MKFNRQQFLTDIHELATMNVRWLHQGFSPDTGMDCIGAFRWLIQKQGVELPKRLLDEWIYSRPPNGQRFLRILRGWLIEIPESDLLPADLIVFYMRRNPQHMAALVEQGVIGEALETTGVSKFLIRPIPSDYCIAACFRIPDEITA